MSNSRLSIITNLNMRRLLLNMFTYHNKFNISRYFSSSTAHSYNPINMREYLKSIEHTLKPPVANRLIYSGDIKLMVVGGPNSRSDYHIEMGEELFYQLQGDMDLDVVIHNQKQRIRIKQGETFLLPAGIPHSPQRYADSIGLVFERDRAEHEADCMRWYTEPDFSGTVYEEYFHCTDLGTQVKAVIENFYRRFPDNTYISNSRQEKPVSIGADLFHSNAIDHLQKVGSFTTKLGFRPPESLDKNIAQSQSISRLDQCNAIYNSQFTMQLFKGDKSQDHKSYIDPNQLSSKEVFLWQHSGSSIVQLNSKHRLVKCDNAVVKGDDPNDTNSIILREGDAVMIHCGDSSRSGDYNSFGVIEIEQHCSNDTILCISSNPNKHCSKML